MDLSTKRRIAADVMGIGKKRVWFDNERLDEVKEARPTFTTFNSLSNSLLITRPPIVRVDHAHWSVSQKWFD